MGEVCSSPWGDGEEFRASLKEEEMPVCTPDEKMLPGWKGKNIPGQEHCIKKGIEYQNFLFRG